MQESKRFQQSKNRRCLDRNDLKIFILTQLTHPTPPTTLDKVGALLQVLDHIFLWWRTHKPRLPRCETAFPFMFAAEIDCVPSVVLQVLLSDYSYTWGVLSHFSTGRADQCACSPRSSIRKHFGQVSWKFARALANDHS
jgi:hypothetical protein